MPSSPRTRRVSPPFAVLARRFLWAGLLFFSAAGAGPADAREIHLTLLHTADVQGHLLALAQREQKDQCGGLLKCASVIQGVREAEEASLLFDTGRLLSGSAESELSKGQLPSRAAGWLRYDARLPDPLDWQSAPERVASLGPLIVSNARSLPASLQAEQAVVPHRTFDVAGLRVGVLGLVDDSSLVPKGVTLAVGPEADALLAERLQRLRAESPQVLVLLLRTGPEPGRCLERARSLALRFPEVDVILGSGNGEVVRSATWDRVLFSQAGRQGRWVGRVDLVYDTVRRQRVSAEADLLEVGAEVEEHGELRRWLGKELATVSWELERVLCTNVRELEGTSAWRGQSGVQRLVSEAVAKATQADVVLLGKDALAALAAGPVTVRDVFRLLPNPGNMATLEVTAAELREVLEENAALGPEEGFLGCHGITYQHDPSASAGERIQDVRLSDGNRPHGRKRLRLALPARLLDGASGRERLRAIAARPETRLRRYPVDTRRVLIDYLANAGSLDLRPLPGLLAPVGAVKTPR